ncbi:tetratricopeptide repeat protein [Gloeobacter kilaueensis]|uniref:Alpha-ketoglutarate decarboxylase n=1 Tax=Gloeobacter kilaueensis (strain ATCC BAA-2537 / CCAP 1431/1 / ULC 316 / JS1) TaxID=1183438 RepID=U5QDR6_GLOK1|nr:tetratricopeptide repeat protein [Gloeobacter kilaueensis]AGY57092.1 alpha-ketoglutarate decarboxylase [Gloeobacter kilaueensis JS1]
MKHLWPLSLSLAALAWTVPIGSLRAETNVKQLFKDAYTQQNKGNYTKALRIWNEVVRRNPTEPAAYVNRGITRYLMRDLRGAADDFSQAISFKDDYADAYFDRAAIYRDLKEYDLAIADYQRYLQLAPNAPDADQARELLSALRKRPGIRTASSRPAPPPVQSRPSPVAPVSRPAAPSAPPPDRQPAPETASTAAPAPGPDAAPPLVSPSTPASTTDPSPPAPVLRTAPPPVASLPSSKSRAGGSAVSVGRVSGYDATTDDILLGLRLGVERNVLSRDASVYKQAQNFVVRMKRGATVDQALEATGLDRQSFLRLAWRGAAWRTYKIYIK